eukprot:1179787-Prorocentrum_minimum.AAC.2
MSAGMRQRALLRLEQGGGGEELERTPVSLRTRLKREEYRRNLQGGVVHTVHEGHRRPIRGNPRSKLRVQRTGWRGAVVWSIEGRLGASTPTTDRESRCTGDGEGGLRFRGREKQGAHSVSAANSSPADLPTPTSSTSAPLSSSSAALSNTEAPPGAASASPPPRTRCVLCSIQRSIRS